MSKKRKPVRRLNTVNLTEYEHGRMQHLWAWPNTSAGTLAAHTKFAKMIKAHEVNLPDPATDDDISECINDNCYNTNDGYELCLVESE